MTDSEANKDGEKQKGNPPVLPGRRRAGTLAPMQPRFSFDKRRIKFLFLEGIHANATAALAANGYANVKAVPKSLTGEALKTALRDIHFLGIRSRTELTEEVLAAAPKLIAIGCFCIGTNQVDLTAAARRGIPVFNAPYSNTRSVAELVIGEVVMLLRGIPGKNALVHRGGWAKGAEGSVEVRGKTLGIVGYGHIGTQVGILAEHFGMRVLYHDIEGKLPLGNARPVPSLTALLEGSDAVTLHVPDTRATRNLIGREQLALMRPGSHLLNASRGTVVDIAALAEALGSGRCLPGRAEGQRRRVPVAPARLRPGHPDAPHRRVHGRGPGQHRDRGGGKAYALLRQRLDRHGGQLSRRHPARPRRH